MAPDAYTLEDAETDIATLRGQVDRLSEVLTKLDSTDPPNTPAAGLIHYSIGGQHKYASSDGGYYNTRRATVYSTPHQVDEPRCGGVRRSGEHTSELQSPDPLVF